MVDTGRQGAQRIATGKALRRAVVVSADDRCGQSLSGYLREAGWTIHGLTPSAIATTVSPNERGNPDAPARGLEASVRLAASEMLTTNALVCVLPPERPGIAFRDIDWRRWTETIRGHVDLVAGSCAGAIPQLIAAGGGSIVIVCSKSGLDGAAAAAHIAAANGAVIGFMKCLALELAPKGIVVNAVVGAPWSADASHQGATAVGGAVRYLLEEASYLAAQTIDVSNER